MIALIQTVLWAALAAAAMTGWPRGFLAGGWIVAAVGFVLCAGAFVVATAAFLAIGKSLSLSPAPRPGASLVDHGIYRHLRHPMYTSAISLSLGVLCLVPTWPVALASAGVILFYLWKSRYEERLLLEHYPGYPAYRVRTRGVLLLRESP